MNLRLLCRLVSILIPCLSFYCAISQATDCGAREEDPPCTCWCDMQPIRAESIGRGVCRAEEEKGNICSLLWNHGNREVGIHADKMAADLNEGSPKFLGADSIDSEVWRRFDTQTKPLIEAEMQQDDLGYEATAIATLNTHPPNKYTVTELHPSLSLLIASRLRVSEFESIDPATLEGDMHELIWKESERILCGMKHSEPSKFAVTGRYSHNRYTVFLSYGCFSARSDKVRVMIKTPFAIAHIGWCSTED
jgi:hypothetical protein